MAIQNKEVRMKGYTLLLLGPPRTATTSVWKALIQHKDIAPPEVKELLNKLYYRYHLIKRRPETFIQHFDIKENQKIILDGTPHAYILDGALLKDIQNQIYINNIKFLYVLRNPYDRLYSYLKIKLMTEEQPKVTGGYGFIDLNDINIDLFFHWLEKFFADRIEIKTMKEFSNDILFLRIDQMDPKKIFDFLQIENLNIRIGHSNRNDEVWTRPKYEKIRRKIKMQIFDEQIDKLAKKFNEDINILQDITKINLSDWIK